MTDTADQPEPCYITDLKRFLPPERLQLLAKLLGQVYDETGYGAVVIVVTDRRIELLKVEQSFR